jgi:putative ABC transport system permease protein
MEGFGRDLRFAIRVLLKSPGVTGIALLTIGIATGANATVFGFVSALLLRPAPGVSDPRSLVSVYTSDYSSGPYGDSSYPDYLSIQADATTLTQVSAERSSAAGNVMVGDTAQRVAVSEVTGEYFAMLGVRPVLGRLLVADDVRAAAPAAVVLGHSLWRDTLGSNEAVLGSAITVNGRSYTVVGIAADGFAGLDLGHAVQAWVPLLPPVESPRERENRSLAVIARLREGATLEEADAQLATIAARLADTYPESNRGTLQAPTLPRAIIPVRHSRLPPDVRPTVAAIGAVLMGAVALVLAMACANVAGLLVSRTIARNREMAVRLALGAGRSRVIRQLLAESLLLGIAGGLCGLLLSLWTSDVLPSFFPAEQARLLDTSVDIRTIAFIGAISIGASLLFGIFPALNASGSVTGASLRGASGQMSAGRSGARLRRLLVGAQVGSAVILLVCSALLVRSLINALVADLGFGTRNGVVASVDARELDDTQALLYFDEVLEHVRSLPGIQAAAWVQTLPLARASRRGFKIEKYQPRPGEDMELVVNVVSPGYFEAMQIPLRAGRTFDPHDRGDRQPVAMVNDLFANRFFAGDALGGRITDSGGRTMEIVGVVQSHKYLTVQEPPVATVYYPLAQMPIKGIRLVARVTGRPSPMIDPIRREMVAINKRVTVFRTIPLADHLNESVAADRLTASLVAVCGGIALLLATIGVYGVVAYAVVRRSKEIGIRVALGARPRDVIRLILAEGFSVTGAGLALGLVGAAAAAQALGSLTPLYGVNALDPMTYAAVPAVLIIVTLVAAGPPTRRALRLDPNVVLRQE